MAMQIIEDECIACGDCEPVCPNSAISESGIAFTINGSLCDECESEDSAIHCVASCPIDGCIMPA